MLRKHGSGGIVELRHLRYFLAVADNGTVSAAADHLHVTQPGLSRQLRQLETELGVELFDRRSGRLTPSRTGRALLPLARDLLERAEALRTAATFHAHGRLDRVTIAAPTVTLTDVVAPFIATLAADDPMAAVFEADARDPVAALNRGADLAIGTVRPHPPYRALVLAVLPVWAYLPPEHEWVGRSSVPLGEVLAGPVIVLPPWVTSRQALETAVASTGVSFADRLEVADGTVAQALAAAGRGVAVVSDDPRFGLARVAVDTDGHRLGVRLIAVWDQRHPAAESVEALAERLGESVRGRYGVTVDPAH
ncbi:LysR family transcriptional regulator [Nocardioides sp.]|uniref:LysR family transcriptional regulator n=1 Tax=Nocardioides sp. TaxID=35761 RepID=UPI002737576E|nr:LysR family transcriptional regulator [Nocardioides sp.]MDP3894333.1 LysR family transcriptional regulator [Nocardioides sp.]